MEVKDYKNICIIGAGQLGSRHLQALTAVKQNLNITVVDPSSQSLNVAKERYEAVAQGSNHVITFSQTQKQLPKNVDVAIFACTSLYRGAALKELLTTHNVRFIILEKWLAESIDTLNEMVKLVESSGAKAWVNCPMRMMPFYEKVKNEFGYGKCTYNVTGTQFGLITNLIHYADFIAWISGCDDFTVDNSLLKRTLPESKRKGYKELLGTIALKYANGTECVVTCNEIGTLPHIMQLSNGERRIIIDESNGVAFWQNDLSVGGREGFELESFSVLYQSQLTTIVVEELLEKGTCRLSTLDVSARIHEQLMRPITAFIEKELNFKEREFPFT